MTSLDPVQLVMQFFQYINKHSPDDLAGLMSERHQFVDSLGSKVEGRESMRDGWIHYFSMFPDYEMKVEETMAQGHVVAAFGTARGTFQVEGKLPPENHWEIPFAVRAVVESNRISQWQVYADNHPVMEIISHNRR
jgi:ketosteroid isomerase-like protein